MSQLPIRGGIDDTRVWTGAVWRRPPGKRGAALHAALVARPGSCIRRLGGSRAQEMRFRRFLHNGSVTNLYDLLLSPARRPKFFYVGSWDFDPVHVGLETGSPFAGAFYFDTRLPGNANSGHEYGTSLSEPDRMALIEFLKTL